MRKWFFSTAICIAILIGAVYIFIPANIEISKIAIVNCTIPGAYRSLSNESMWSNQWSDNITNQHLNKSDSGFHDGSFYYTITQKLRNEIIVLMQDSRSELNSRIRLIARGADSVILIWECSLPSGRNPIHKIIQYREAVHISDNMKITLKKIADFLGNPKNVYGISISQSSISDTCLLASKYSFSDYPTTREIYDAVSTLKLYAFENGTLTNGQPLMNINKVNDQTYLTMIAIPVNRDLPATGKIFSKRMVPGRFMVADVRGGIEAVNMAVEQMQLYFEDYQKTSMAVPFQSLITDRSAESDTSKWVTRIYAPVMQ